MLRVFAALLMLPAAFSATRDIVVFDTDCGIFGDDGAALVMLAAQPGSGDLRGITRYPVMSGAIKGRNM